MSKPDPEVTVLCFVVLVALSAVFILAMVFT